MVEMINNVSGINEAIVPIVTSIITEQFSWIPALIQAVGILFILYMIYIIITAIYKYKNRARMKRIESKIDEIDKKISRLLKRAKKK